MEVILSLLGVNISNASLDTIVDVSLGAAGGGAGAYMADHYLDRLFKRSRWDSLKRSVR